MKKRIVWIRSDKKTIQGDLFKLLIETGLYKEEPVPPVVDLNNKESEVTQYYLARLQEEYVGTIVILDKEKVFISVDN